MQAPPNRLVPPPMTAPTYFAMIGDVMGSRQLEDRAAVQQRLREAIASLNATRRDLLTVPMKLTAGDEVQGLTTEPHVLIDVLTTAAEALHPVQISWGLGLGDLATDLVDDVALLDGSCFHRAREAVDAAKHKSSWLEVRGFPKSSGEMLAAAINLVGAIRSGWTPRQAQVVREARGRKQSDVAEELDVAASTISRTLAAAHYKWILEAEDAARSLLRQLRPSA